MTRSFRVLSLLAVLCALAPAIHAQVVVEVARANQEQIARLDRAKTVVLLVGSILEEHGPHFPVWSDGVRNEAMADSVTRVVLARGWSVLRFPVIPLGAHPFNEAAGRPVFRGSFPVRPQTVRAVFMDLADALGGQGFRHVLVLHGHGAPDHNRALDQAGDYFRDSYGGWMVNLIGRVGCQPDLGQEAPPALLLPPAAAAENNNSPHADAVEGSRVLFLRPDLVDPAHVNAPSIPATPPEWRTVGARPDWPGYIGAPRFATRALGRWEWARHSSACMAMANRLLDGTDERTIPRYADQMLAIPPVAADMEALRANDAARAAAHARWLAAREQAPPRP
ncbi:MAG TPA: creatininase family protein [Longimicrobium sp.]|nr:creatininase family protein [Longimicrobium sp.]